MGEIYPDIKQKLSKTKVTNEQTHSQVKISEPTSREAFKQQQSFHSELLLQ